MATSLEKEKEICSLLVVLEEGGIASRLRCEETTEQTETGKSKDFEVDEREVVFSWYF